MSKKKLVVEPEKYWVGDQGGKTYTMPQSGKKVRGNSRDQGYRPKTGWERAGGKGSVTRIGKKGILKKKKQKHKLEIEEKKKEQKKCQNQGCGAKKPWERV